MKASRGFEFDSGRGFGSKSQGVNKKLWAENRAKLRATQSKGLPEWPKFDRTTAGRSNLPEWVIDDLFSSCPDWAIEDGLADILINPNYRYLDGYDAKQFGGYSESSSSEKARSLEGGIWHGVGQTIDGGLVESADWKPLNPIVERDENGNQKTDENGKVKVRKYDCRHGAQDRPFLHQIPWLIGQRIAARYELAEEYRSRQGDAKDYEVDAGFWAWALRHPEIELVVTEGLKKALSLLLHGVLAISVKGAYNWHIAGDDRILHSEIEQFAKAHQILSAFDRDSKPKTVRAVFVQTRKFAKAVKAIGGSAKALYWDPQDGKGIDDLLDNAEDSIALLQLVLDSRVSTGELYNLLFATDEEVDPKEERKQLIEKRMRFFRNQFWDALTRDYSLGKADVEYEGWCPVPDFGLARTFLIQGWLGAGKTEAVLRFCKNYSDEHPDHFIVWVTNRNGLGHGTVKRAEELELQVWHYQSDVTGNRQLIEANNGGMLVMCPESFKEYAVGQIPWEKTLLVTDEFRSVRCSILERSEEFPQFEEALYRAHKVVVADALLSDADRAVLKPCIGKDRIIYQQKFAKSPKKIRWVESLTAKGLTSFRHEGAYLPLLNQMIELGGRTAIATDNRLLANIFQNHLEAKGKRVLVASSETIDSNKVLLPNPTAVIDQQDPDFFIYTPTIQAGADIQSKFDRGLLICTGVLSPIDMLQMLGRCRQCPEWWVSYPRKTDFDTPFEDLDGKRIAQLGDKLNQVFESLEIPGQKQTSAWAQWQVATGDVEKAFGSEYLYCLLEKFFESVETVEFSSTGDEDDTKAFISLIKEARREEVRKRLEANLESGQGMIAKQKNPATDQEYWDLALAKWHAEYPQVIDLLRDLHKQGWSKRENKFEYTNDYQDHLDLGRLFISSSLNRIKDYRLSLQEGVEEKLLKRIQVQRFVSFQSRAWKQYRSIRLFRTLKLEDRLAKVSAIGAKVERDVTGFTIDSPIVAEIAKEFNSNRDLKQLFPEIDSTEKLWGLIRRTMSRFGFESCGVKQRIETEDLHQDGYKKDRSPRLTRSKVVHLSAWRIHRLSGSELFRANYNVIIEAIDHSIDREDDRWDDYFERRERRSREREMIAA